MAEPAPLAAVCVPVHRPRPDHLRASLASALAQTVGCEVAVGADPTDAGLVQEVLAELGVGHRVQVVARPAGAGMVADWRAVVSATDAPVVVVPGQDDVLRPAMVERHLEVLADRDVVLVASAAALVGDDGAAFVGRGRRVHGREAVLAGRPRRRLDRAQAVRIVLRNGNVLGAPAQVCFRREAHDRVGGFDERYEHAADADLWLRLACEGDLVLLAEPLGTRRVHADAATGAHRRSGAAARDRARLAADHGGVLDPTSAGQAAVARTRWSLADAARAATRGEVTAVRRHLAAARADAPRDRAAWSAMVGEWATGRNLDA